MLNPELLQKKILSAFPDAEAKVNDTTGTGDHFEAYVVTKSFEGKPLVEQHQMVYALFQDELKTGALHALALKTYTPDQWKKKLGGAR